MTPNTIQFHSDNHTEVLRLSKDGIWANPDIPVDEAAKLVLEAMEWSIKVLVDKAIGCEREALGKLDWTAIMREGGLVTWGDAEELGDRVLDILRNRGST